MTVVKLTKVVGGCGSGLAGRSEQKREESRAGKAGNEISNLVVILGSVSHDDPSNYGQQVLLLTFPPHGYHLYLHLTSCSSSCSSSLTGDWALNIYFN